MSFYYLSTRVLFLFVAASCAACSSVNSSASGDSNIACILPGGCTLSTNVPAGSVAAVQGDCNDAKGMLASACPTADVIACCTEGTSGDTSVIFCAYGDSGVAGSTTPTGMCNQ